MGFEAKVMRNENVYLLLIKSHRQHAEKQYRDHNFITQTFHYFLSKPALLKISLILMNDVFNLALKHH